MTCTALRNELFGYHFGTLSDEARGAVERHLVDCRACLAEFIALKRAIETAEHQAPASASARQRLREAVARELGLTGTHAVTAPRRSHWERPFALSIAAMTVACALFLVHAFASGTGRMPRALTVQERAPTETR
jgi:anti-sigma factor RsiW